MRLSNWPPDVTAEAGGVFDRQSTESTKDSSVTQLRDTPSTRFDRWAIAQIRRSLASAPVRFCLWDGYEASPRGGATVASVRFLSRRALLASLWNPDLNFGEGYMSGEIEVSGDLVSLLEAIYRAMPSTTHTPWWSRTRGNTTRVSFDNVHHHYDLGDRFYQLWLDQEMLYTCAYFPTPEASLDEAQTAKMDLVCRKLDLKPGDRVIEAGCGWGSLARFMAARYGVTVRAYNISRAQVAYARARAVESGLSDRVEFIDDDYRNIRGECDVFVSVGMLEHVGRADYPTLGEVIDRCLTVTGRGLLHFIGRDHPLPLNPWIRKRIFPGAYPPTLAEVFTLVFQPRGFSVFDVENLRLHYAKTLEWWLRRFEASERQVAGMFSEEFVRAWRLYLAGSQAAFSTGAMQLFQVLFTRGGSTSIPWRRLSA